MSRFIHSIRFRLTVYYLLIFLFILLLFSGILLSLYRHHLFAKAESSLRDKSFVAGAWIDFSNNDFSNQAIDYLHSQESDLILLLYDRNGRLIGKSTSNIKNYRLPKEIINQVSLSDEPKVYESEDNNYLIAVNNLFDNDKQKGYVQLIQNKNSIFESFNYLLKITFIGLTIAAIIGFISGLFLVNQLLEPINKIVDKVNSIQAEKLNTEKLSIYNPNDELGKLSITINSLLDRIDLSIQNQKKFISDAAHELRTPLAILKGNTEVAIIKDGKSNTLSKNLTEINHLISLTNDLLMMARFDNQSMKLEIKKVNLSNFLKDIIINFENTFHNSNLNCISNIEGNLIVHCDPFLFRRVLYNLIDNAIKYRGAGKELTISLRKYSSEKIQLVIKDSGIGIPSEKLPYIFERFYRANEDRNKTIEGTGLGLSIVKSILDLHQYSINIHSEINKGTTVIILI